jgi:hypothetical protein
LSHLQLAVRAKRRPRSCGSSFRFSGTQSPELRNTIWGLVPGTSESIRLAAKQHYLNNKQLICAQCGGDKRYSNAGGQGILEVHGLLRQEYAAGV